MSETQHPDMSGRKLVKSDRIPETEPKGTMADLTRKREEARKIAQERAREKNTMRKIQVSQRIATASDELASAIAEGSGTAEELFRSMEQIASGSHQASSSTEESHAAVTQIERNSRRNSQLAHETFRKIEILKVNNAAITETLRNLIEGVAKSSEAASLTAGRMHDLVRQSEEIGRIVDVVMKIADQTGLLALNAAIEAVRAEEAGRGFAVVADEVRALSDSTERSAQGIRELVREIQTAVGETVSEIERLAESARLETGKGNTINTDLTSLGEGMDEFLETARQTGNGIEEILRDAGEFLAVSETIASAAEEISLSCEQALSGTDQQMKAFTDMSGAAEELSNTTDEIRKESNFQRSSEELSSMALELSANLEEAGAASQELSRAISQIRSSTELQSRETERGGTIGEAMTALINRVAESARELQEKAVKMKDRFYENSGGVRLFLEGIHRAAADNIRTAESIRKLDERSVEIAKIAESISSVTIQTNMLAVTGAVEAARVGEAGQGFAHVAADIRKLAVDSGLQAERIKDVARKFQYTISRSAIDIENVGVTAIQEADRAQNITGSLDGLIKNIDSITVSMESLKATQDEARRSIEQAQSGMEQISSAAIESVSALNQASTAAEQQARGLHELIRAIDEITSLADELKEF